MLAKGCRETDTLIYCWWECVQTLSEDSLVAPYEAKHD